MNWLDVFHSSGFPRRQVELGRIEDWVDSEFLSMQRVAISNSRRIRLYLTIEKRLAQFHKIEISDLKSSDFMMIEHLSSTTARLFGNLGRVGGGSEHQLIANIASLFLLDLGKEVLTEVKFNSRRVDLLAADYSCVIECGDTNAPPIVDHLYDGNNGMPCSFVGVMPFQDLIDDPFMYVFKRGVNWNESAARDIYFGGSHEYPRDAGNVEDRTPPNVYQRG